MKKDREEKIYTNYNIFPGKVRLIQENGNQVVVDRDDAIELASSKNMDLVQIAYNKGSFPAAICKILDYSKFMYEKHKKEKAAKKAAKANEASMKEMSFTIRIDDGDYKTKMNHVRSFIDEGLKVKLTIRLARREANMVPFAKQKMNSMISDLSDIAEVDVSPSYSGNVLSCIVKAKKLQ